VLAIFNFLDDYLAFECCADGCGCDGVVFVFNAICIPHDGAVVDHGTLDSNQHFTFVHEHHFDTHQSIEIGVPFAYLLKCAHPTIVEQLPLTVDVGTLALNVFPWHVRQIDPQFEESGV